VGTLRASEPSVRRPERRARHALLALASSLAVNGAAFLALERAGAFTLAGPVNAQVALAPVLPDAWERNRGVEAAPAPPPASAIPTSEPPRREPPGPRDEAAPDRPVVAVAPSPDPRRPENARFLADRDNTVPRDRQSRHAAEKAWKTILARPTPGEDEAAAGIPERGDDGEGDLHVPGREGPRPTAPAERPREEVEAAIARARLALGAPGPTGGARADEPPAAVSTEGEGGARRSGRYDPRLLPTAASFRQLSGGGPSAQRLDGVDVGDETVLSTRRFKHAEFYVRLKDAFLREFDPDRAWNLRDPRSVRYGRARRRTTVDVVLDREGAVLDVRVVRTSGLDFYDAEVVRAFRAAAPYPNPPLGLARSDGTIVVPSYEVAYRHPDLLRGVARDLAPLTGGLRAAPGAPE
jgi:TonB family protein